MSVWQYLYEETKSHDQFKDAFQKKVGKLTKIEKNVEKIERGIFGGKVFPEKKFHNAEKCEGGFFSRPSLYVTRKKKEKPFWFSSLVQQVEFGKIFFTSYCLIF